MRTLSFNREAAREDYLRLYNDQALNERDLELMLLRGELLARNEPFIKEWEKLKESKQKQHKNYHEAERAFRKRWSIDDHDLYAMRDEPDPIVQGYGGHPSRHHGFGYCTLIVDLRYSKRKIMDRIGAELDKYLRWYKEGLAEGYIESNIDDPDERERARRLPKRLKGYIPADLKDYVKYLHVWDLKEKEGKSWFQIQKQLDVSFDTARNWHRAASRLIKEGIPGFPPFPKD